MSVSLSCLFHTEHKLTDVGQRNIPIYVNQIWHTFFQTYYLSFSLSVSNMLNHLLFMESSIFFQKLALSVEKKLKNHGKCSCSIRYYCARFSLGLDQYTSADLNTNLTWGQAKKNLVFSHRVTTANLLNKSDETNQLLHKFTVTHGQCITLKKQHSNLIRILHYYYYCCYFLRFWLFSMSPCQVAQYCHWHHTEAISGCEHELEVWLISENNESPLL